MQQQRQLLAEMLPVHQSQMQVPLLMQVWWRPLRPALQG